MLGKELKAKFEEFTQFTSDERPSDPGIKMHAGLYFHANDVWESEVGDIRVQFSYAGRDGEQVNITRYKIWFIDCSHYNKVFNIKVFSFLILTK